MAEAFYLTAADVAAVKALLRANRDTAPARNSDDAKVDREEILAPEVYVCKTPADGVPARVGTVPGVAECDVYRLTRSATGYTMDLVRGLTRDVVNLSSTAARANSYAAVTREKYGAWVLSAASNAVEPVSGGSCAGLAWLLSVKTTFYLKFELIEAVGECGCSAYTHEVGPDTYLVWDSGESKFTSRGKVQTCCGCGDVKLAFDYLTDVNGDTAADFVNDLPKMTLTTVACGSGGAVTKKVQFLCAGRDDAGRPWAEFAAYHPDLCDGTNTLGTGSGTAVTDECENHVKYRITCHGSECPYDTAACTSCAEGQMATKYKITATFGAPYAHMSGTYYLDGGGCGASGSCEPTGVTAAFTLTGTGPTSGTLTFTDTVGTATGSLTYDLIEDGLGYRAECLNSTGNPLRFQNLSSPGGITQIDADAVTCDDCTTVMDALPDTLYATVNGNDFTITRTPGTDTWQGNNGIFSYDDPTNSAGLILTFDPDNCNFSATVVASFCGPGCTDRQYPTSLRDPFLVEGSCSDSTPGCPTTATFSVTDEPPP